MARRTPGCERVRTVLPKSIHQWGPRVEKEYLVHSVRCHWPELVGEMIAANVEAVRIERHTLWLSCYNASWRNEIMLQQLQIIDRVNRYAGSHLVKELRFCTPRKKAELEALEPPEEADTLGSLPLGRVLPKISLSAEALQKAEAMGQQVKDTALQQKIRQLYQKQLQLETLERQKAWHPCKRCNALCPRESDYCSVCARAVRQETEEKIRQFLKDMPWARYGDVHAYIPCSAPMVNLQRVRLVQTLAKRVEVGDTTSLDAKTLVMLYRCVPPEQLTEDLIVRTLYRLRNDLRKPRDFKPRKRYEAIGHKAAKRSNV